MLIALGSGRKGTVRSVGTKHVVDAMERRGIRRLVCQTTLGAGDSRALLNFFWKYIMFGLLLREVYADHETQEAFIRQSALDWIIVRPGAFTDGPATGTYQHGFPPTAKKIQIQNLPSRCCQLHAAATQRRHLSAPVTQPVLLTPGKRNFYHVGRNNMTSMWIFVLCEASVIVCGVVSGVFLTFSDFVMRSLGAARTAAGVEVMQFINREVYRSVFMFLLLGMSAFSLFLVVYAYFRLAGPATSWVMAGGTIYFTVCVCRVGCVQCPNEQPAGGQGILQY